MSEEGRRMHTVRFINVRSHDGPDDVAVESRVRLYWDLKPIADAVVSGLAPYAAEATAEALVRVLCWAGVDARLSPTDPCEVWFPRDTRLASQGPPGYIFVWPVGIEGRWGTAVDTTCAGGRSAERRSAGSLRLVFTGPPSARPPTADDLRGPASTAREKSAPPVEEPKCIAAPKPAVVLRDGMLFTMNDTAYTLHARPDGLWHAAWIRDGKESTGGGATAERWIEYLSQPQVAIYEPEATIYDKEWKADEPAPSRDDILRAAVADVPEGVTRDAWRAFCAHVVEHYSPTDGEDWGSVLDDFRRDLAEYERIRAALLRGGRVG